MTVRFYAHNLTDKATITPSSENAEFPVSNILDNRRTKVFRSTSNSTSIVFDFGTFQEIDSFAIVGHTFYGFGFTSITLEFNNTNSWTTPAFSQTLTPDYEFDFCNFEFSNVQNYRYARLVLTNTEGFCEISNVFFGKRTQFVDTDYSYPLGFRYKNLGTINKNRYGQKFVDEITLQKLLDGKIDYIASSNIDEYFEMTDLLSTTVPFFVVFDTTTIMGNMNRMNGMYYFSDESDPKLQSGNYWTDMHKLEEAM